MTRRQKFTLAALATVLLFLAMDAACAIGADLDFHAADIHASGLEYSQRREEIERACIKAGGVPIYSGWTNMLKDCRKP